MKKTDGTDKTSPTVIARRNDEAISHGLHLYATRDCRSRLGSFAMTGIGFVKTGIRACAVALVALTLLGTAAQAEERTVPIVYVTDLYHPYQDPDDHFDLATLFALPEFDIRAIVIDMGREGVGRPGLVPVRQMMRLTGRTAPCATGLTANLEGPTDAAEDQPADAQAGVDLILTTLRESAVPVTVFTTGSLRDVAAAYNRAPDVFDAKVARLYVNAGHSSGKTEWNVGLDPHAYVRILRSSLPVYWVPCFGTRGFQSLWTFEHREVLDAAAPPLQNFFLYALSKADPDEVDPLDALDKPVSEESKTAWWDKERKMWCTAAFLHAAGREDAPFAFPTMHVNVTDAGTTSFVPKAQGVAVRTFRCQAPVAYLATMRGTLRLLLIDMPLAAVYGVDNVGKDGPRKEGVASDGRD